jgi:hypothetical protein
MAVPTLALRGTGKLNASPFTIQALTGLQVGDLQIHVIMTNTAGASMTAVPTGFQLFGAVYGNATTGDSVFIYYKYADAADVANTTGFTYTANGNFNFVWGTMAIRGMDTSNPFDGTPQVTNEAAATGTHVLPSINTSGADRLLLFVAASGIAAAVVSTIPANMTTQFDTQAGTNRWLWGGSEPDTTAGASGTRTITSSVTTTICTLVTFAVASPTTPATRIAPDGIISLTNLTGALGDITDDPDNPGTTWLVAP